MILRKPWHIYSGFFGGMVSSQCTSFSRKMVLKRLFFGDTGEALVSTFIIETILS